MNKAVLISIRPEWVRKILNGSKTVEIRKTEPKCGVPFKCYIYCTAGKGGAHGESQRSGAGYYGGIGL